MARPWAQGLPRAPSPSAGCPLARRAASEEGPVHTHLRQSMGPPLEGPPQQEQLRAIAPCLPGSDAPGLPTALQGRAQAMQRAGIQAASLSHTCMPWQDTRAGLLPSRHASCSRKPRNLHTHSTAVAAVQQATSTQQPPALPDRHSPAPGLAASGGTKRARGSEGSGHQRAGMAAARLRGQHVLS